MGAVLAALGTISAVVVAGVVLGRRRTLGPDAERVLARTTFSVALPALLVVTLAQADLHLLLSRIAAGTALSTVLVAATALGVLRGVWRRGASHAVIGALSASYVNAAYVGIPIAVYLLGDAVAVVPTLLVQQVVLGPLAYAVLERRSAGPPAPDGGSPRRAWGRWLARVLMNPVLVATLVGVALALVPWHLPEVVYEPLRLVGAAAAPLALLAFGMSLASRRSPGTPPDVAARRELVLVGLLRAVVHPALALGIGLLLGLSGEPLRVVVTMATLPTAQNVLVFAMHYGRGVALARDAGVVTTALSLPALLVVSALLGAG